jgi:hypothetical protein
MALGEFLVTSLNKTVDQHHPLQRFTALLNHSEMSNAPDYLSLIRKVATIDLRYV